MDKNPTTTTVKTPADNFTGDVWMNPVFNGDGTSKLTVGLVRFTLDASGDAEATTWLEPVSDEQYAAAHNTADIPGQV